MGGGRGLEHCLGPPSSTRPGVALAVLSPRGGDWAIAAPQPASPPTPPPAPRRPERRQTVGKGASDSLPDLPGSPRLPADG